MTADSGHSHPFAALGVRLLAMVMLATMFALVKLIAERGTHVVETLFYRQLFALPVAAFALQFGPGFGALRTPRIGKHITRSAVGMVGMLLNFGAYILLPLAEATTIGFTVPIFATILSVLFLGERPGIHRWLAIVAGLIGVIVIVGPAADTHGEAIGVIVAIAAAIATSVVSLLLRQLGRTEPATTTVFYFAALSLPPLGIAMIWFGRSHDTTTWLLLLAMGVSGGLGQLLMTLALRWGPVSLVLPMDYSSLLWSTGLGWIIWNAWPGPATWIGAVIIAASGLYIVWRERVRHRENVTRGVSVS